MKTPLAETQELMLKYKAQRDELAAVLRRAEMHLRFLGLAMSGELASSLVCTELADQARAALAKLDAKPN